jgi:P2-related tail formation protein
MCLIERWCGTPSAHPNQVHLELGERGEGIEEQLPHRVVRVVDLTAERQRHRAHGESVTDVSGTGNGSSKSAELRHDEYVARTHRRQCLIEAGTLSFGAADAVIDEDTIRRNAERVKCLTLSSEILLVSRASGVSQAP